MRNFLPYACILGCVMFVCFPFFQSGYFQTDDGGWAVVRLAEMKREIRDLQIPPRWSGFLNHGYGYPLFLFTYPFPYIVGAGISFLGVGLESTIKILFVMSTFVAGIGMYLCAKEFSGVHGGVIASLLYLLAPFRIVDMYQRGSLGEIMSMALFPLLCWIGVLYVYTPTRRLMVVSSLALAAMLMTHNAMALLFLPWWVLFLCVIAISCAESPVFFFFSKLFPMILLGSGMASFFVVPALFESRYIALSQVPLTDISQHFLSWKDLFYIPGYVEGNRSFSLGIFILGAGFVSWIVMMLSGPIERKKYLGIGGFIVLYVLTSWLLVSAPSLPIWQSTMLGSIDFPWRILSVWSFFLALGTMFLGIHRWSVIIGYVCVVGALWTVMPMIQPTRADARPDSYYETNDGTTTSADELMPIWVKQKATDQPTSVMNTISGNADISLISRTSHLVQVKVVAQTPVILHANMVYFPGWQVWTGGSRIPVSRDNPRGLIAFDLASGTHNVQIMFTETPIRSIGNTLSLLSLCIGAFFWIFPHAFIKKEIETLYT